MINIDEVKEMADQGREEFEKRVMEGSLFKDIVNRIEGSALEGYEGYGKVLNLDDDFREIKVIKKYLIESGFECEIETKQKQSAMRVSYTTTKFIVRW